MLQHVAEGVSKSDKVDRWLIATDSQKILDTVKGFGGEAVLTRRDHPTGTDRISEVVKNLPGFEIILNIQGDEPLVNTSLIDSLILPLMEKQAEVSTLKRRVSDPKEINNPNIVKKVK